MSNSANCFVFLLNVFRIMTFGGTPFRSNNFSKSSLWVRIVKSFFLANSQISISFAGCFTCLLSENNLRNHFQQALQFSTKY